MSWSDPASGWASDGGRVHVRGANRDDPGACNVEPQSDCRGYLLNTHSEPGDSVFFSVVDSRVGAFFSASRTACSRSRCSLSSCNRLLRVEVFYDLTFDPNKFLISS